jgi:hypothetical protein
MRTVKVMPLASVSAGTELGGDLLDGSGRRLLPAGAILTDASIRLLAKRGIESVQVLVTVQLDPARQASLRAEIEDRLEQRFRNIGAEPVMQTLREVLMAHFMKGIE